MEPRQLEPGAGACGARESLAYRSLIDGGMIYDGRQRVVHHLNATAACVWEGFQAGCTADQIAARLCELYEVPGPRARADVDRLMAEFSAAGLIAP